MGVLGIRISVFALAGLLGLADAARAQQARPAPAPGPIAQAAAEIARGMQLRADEGTDAQGRPVFRSSVTQTLVTLPPPWIDTDRGPGRYRLPVPAAEYERRRLTTPEAFRGSALYSGGVGVDPGAIRDAITGAWRDWQTQRIRARIQKELEELEAARARSVEMPPED